VGRNSHQLLRQPHRRRQAAGDGQTATGG
jgi:hypothetical protein